MFRAASHLAVLVLATATATSLADGRSVSDDGQPAIGALGADLAGSALLQSTASPRTLPVQAQASATDCSQIQNGTTTVNGDVVVKGSCKLPPGLMIQGSIKVLDGGSLYLDGGVVVGSVRGKNVGSIKLQQDFIIKGGIQLKGGRSTSGALEIHRGMVFGGVSLSHTLSDVVISADVSGGVKFFDHQGPISIYGSLIDSVKVAQSVSRIEVSRCRIDTLQVSQHAGRVRVRRGIVRVMLLDTIMLPEGRRGPVLSMGRSTVETLKLTNLQGGDVVLKHVKFPEGNRSVLADMAAPEEANGARDAIDGVVDPPAPEHDQQQSQEAATVAVGRVVKIENTKGNVLVARTNTVGGMVKIAGTSGRVTLRCSSFDHLELSKNKGGTVIDSCDKESDEDLE